MKRPRRGVLVWIRICLLYQLVAGQRTSLCDSIDFSKQKIHIAKCARETKCDITSTKGDTPHCRIQFGEACRTLPSERKQTGRPLHQPRPFPGRLSKLGVHLEMDSTGYGHYSFHTEIAIQSGEIAKENVLGMRMTFEAGDESNCLLKKMPSCKLFRFSEDQSSAGTSRNGQKTSGDTKPKAPSPHPEAVPSWIVIENGSYLETAARDPQTYDNDDGGGGLEKNERHNGNSLDVQDGEGDMVYISHSCFAKKVEPGLFILSLTSLPSQEPLVYRIKWHYLEDYGESTDIWSEQVVGVASVQRANEIQVVIQQPIAILEDSRIGLDLWNSTHRVDSVTIPASQWRATFRQVPKGRYRVFVCPKGYPCVFSSSCPCFWSDEVEIESSVNVLTSYGKGSESRGEIYFLAGLVSATLVFSACVMAALVYLQWRKKKRRMTSPPTVLLIGLDAGCIQGQILKYLSHLIRDISHLNIDSAILVGADDLSARPETPELQEMTSEPPFKIQYENNNNNIESCLTAQKRRRLDNYKAVILVSFLRQFSPSESGGVVAETILTTKLDTVISMFSKRKRKRRKFALLYFIDSSQHQLQSQYSSSGRSSNESTTDADDIFTVLLSSNEKDKKDKSMSVVNINMTELHQSDRSWRLPYFLLPMEAQKFFVWVSSVHRARDIPPVPQLARETIAENENWKIMMFLSKKVFHDKNNPFVSSVNNDPSRPFDEVVTIDTDSIDVSLSAQFC